MCWLTDGNTHQISARKTKDNQPKNSLTRSNDLASEGLAEGTKALETAARRPRSTKVVRIIADKYM